MILALFLTAVWYVLSGRLDLLHFGTGVVVAVVITATFHGVEDHSRFHPFQFLLFLPWLAGQIIASNLRVARAVLSPRLPIAPTFLSQEPGVYGPRGLATLGASITLTPGTLTVDVTQDEILVHALDTTSADQIERGVMAGRVAPVFEEPAS
ncbi:MAG: Na+/H+ antiporter subunit E [Gemmatimonadota bacterium]